VPPLALLVALLSALFLLCGVALLLGAGAWPFILAFTGLALLTVAVFLSWWGWGHKVISAKALLSAPIYILAKIPLYFRFWSKRQKDWVRTDRD